MPSDCCYFVGKAAAAGAAPALKYFCSILHCPAVFTQNWGQTSLLVRALWIAVENPAPYFSEFGALNGYGVSKFTASVCQDNWEQSGVCQGCFLEITRYIYIRQTMFSYIELYFSATLPVDMYPSHGQASLQAHYMRHQDYCNTHGSRYSTSCRQ